MRFYPIYLFRFRQQFKVLGHKVDRAPTLRSMCTSSKREKDTKLSGNLRDRTI